MTARLGSLLDRLDGTGTKANDGGREPSRSLARSWTRSGTKAFGDANVILPRFQVADTVPLGRDQTWFAAQFPNPTIDDGQGSVSYVRESVRTNNAALVQPGAVKPTSVITLERKAHDVLHLATLTEPIENLMLRSGQHRLGSSTTSSGSCSRRVSTRRSTPCCRTTWAWWTLPFATDVATSVRKGVTALQTAGYVADFVAVHPSDAEAIDLAGTALTYSWPTSPEGTASSAWGLRVVVAAGLTPGFGYVSQSDSTSVLSGRLAIEGDCGRGRVREEHDDPAGRGPDRDRRPATRRGRARGTCAA